MADDAISALFDGAQVASDKIRRCRMCGASIPNGIGRPRVYCVDCRESRKYEIQRNYDVARRPPTCTIGESMTCEDCGCECTRNAAAQRFCAECAIIRNRERERQRVRDPDKAAIYQKRFIEKQSTDYGKLRARKYNDANREVINTKSREKNKTPERKAYMAEWDAKNRAKPKQRVDQRMKSAIKLALKGKKAGRKWESLVGYTVDDLYAHLEKQFLPGMSWENMGEWHIDHIRPKSSFDYEDDKGAAFLECWALTNLQPLWAEDNLSKGDKRLYLI